MTDPGFDKFPVIVQLVMAGGATVAGIIAFFWGTKNKPSTDTDVKQRELDDTEREVERLKLEVAIADLRRNLEQVVAAASTAVNHTIEREVAELSDRINSLSERLRTVEIGHARLEGLQR